jgi:hypothetical protein
MATIVIKVNDTYFLQQVTYLTYSSKINIGTASVFFSASNRNTIYGTNLPAGIRGLFPLIKKIESEDIFGDILKKVGTYPLVNLFSAKYSSPSLSINPTFAVRLMRQAFPKTQSLDENLLNYYYLDVPDPSALMLIDTLKNLPGVDKVYVRGELSSIKEPSQNLPNTKTDIIDAILWEGIEIKDKFTPIENLPETPPSFEIKSEIAPAPINSKLADEMLDKFQEIKPSENINQNKSDFPSINEKITSLFGYCGLKSTDEVKNIITVVDFEFGWGFVNNDSLYTSLQTSTIFGGGSLDTQFANHGQKVLNILFGQTTSTSEINGLCKGATAKMASPWFCKTNSKQPHIYGKQPEPALVKTLVDSGMVKGDILLLEVQKDRWNRLDLPVEIESALHAVIKLGVKAGFIIIECAANGGHNLNNNITNVSTVSLSTLPAGIKTVENPPVDISTKPNGTGSIMVGGRDKYFKKDTNLNHGDRVDYYCFGETSLTSSSTLLPPNDNTFSATSLAGAITTALVAHFQSEALNTVSQGGIGRRLTISEIKLLLGSIPYIVDMPPPTPQNSPTPISSPNETTFQNFLRTRGITTNPLLP